MNDREREKEAERSAMKLYEQVFPIFVDYDGCINIGVLTKLVGELIKSQPDEKGALEEFIKVLKLSLTDRHRNNPTFFL